MFKSQAAKGYLFVIVSVLAMANVYIFSKASLNIVSLAQFGFWWFGFAVIFNLFLNRKTFNSKEIAKIRRSKIKILILVGILELVGTTAFFLAIKSMSNPAIVSFFANSTPVFVSILGILFLKERFKRPELFGILFALTGSFVIAYKPGFEAPENFYGSFSLIILSSISFSVSMILSKKNIKHLPPSALTINRTLFLFTASLIYLVLSGQEFLIPQKAMLYTAAGALLGPYLAAYAGYQALNYIEASRTSVLGSSKSMFVLITSFIYFDILPTKLQIIGGLFTILGVLLLSVGKIVNVRKTLPLKNNV
jgi:drug/metabolite transporter (DMT)-like permease